jgi:hypothetical protein
MSEDLTDKENEMLLRLIAALEDDAKVLDAGVAHFRPEFEACWDRDAAGAMGRMVNHERALQLRDLVLTPVDNAKYKRALAAAVRKLMGPIEERAQIRAIADVIGGTP